ncbi:MAG: MinD/ParA family protein [Candidatus Magnetobacterium sp. LHC-1]|uniref:MinD/ParA family protein n=1 Tax=Candidatus Magnetobacterium casense TaxID=1455061 RepID=A0ABS6RX33_9BACT|nr:MinD/ParA family protein [Candidatus Magnetobacterium casensis]MBF0608249.1 MinD/ParA family protein [Nitrospirota bacterium]MBV6341141.1 MinD/ParA family protein [Candidatus Magnetobacterium casensis]
MAILGQTHVRTIAVASGKGGVGKTNVVANLAIALQKEGCKVLILDADLGLSNIDVLLHLAPRYNIQHVLDGEMKLKDIVVEGPYGIKVLPATSGVQEMTSLDEFQRLRFLEEFESLEEDINVLLIDTAAGISENVAFFCIAAQEIIIVTSPDPTSIADAYALIKVLYTRYQEKSLNVLVNSAEDETEAKDVFKRLLTAAEKFLHISLDYLGFIPRDNAVVKAVKAQKAFVEAFPDSKASKKVAELAKKILSKSKVRVKGSLQFFIGNLLSSSSESTKR